jgi:hypothetical protein
MSSIEVTKAQVLGLKVARGFRVYSPDGYVGVVEAVRSGRQGTPTTVGVRTGLFVPRTLLVPADSVACVNPREPRVFSAPPRRTHGRARQSSERSRGRGRRSGGGRRDRSQTRCGLHGTAACR